MTVGADTGQEGGAGTRCPLQMCRDGAEGEEPDLSSTRSLGEQGRNESFSLRRSERVAS